MRIFSGALAALLLTAIAAAAAPVTLTDAAGRTVTITDTSRIVSVGGTVTEILYALGLEERIAGVDQTSTFPLRAMGKPNVGYMRALSAEGVLSLGPTLVLAIEDSGPKEAIAVLEAASVPFVLIPKAHDGESIAKTIRMVAQAAGAGAEGERLAATVLNDVAALGDIRKQITAHKKATFILSMTGGAPVVGGDGTGAADIFRMAGVDNALAGMHGYRPASDEAALAADPDVIVMMAERNEGIGDDAVLGAPAFAGTTAAAEHRLIRMSGTYLLNFGPRAAHAARDLAAAAYPELHLPELPPRPWTTAAKPAD